jgi:hypothetical protein
MTGLESEFYILSLSWLKTTAYWKDIENFVNRQGLGLLLSLLGLVFLLYCVEASSFFLKEAPLVADWHLRDVGEHQILPL